MFDNGANIDDSRYLLDLCHADKINFYTRSANNLYFGFGRNICQDIACGDIIVFSDNDIEYSPGWLDKCLEILYEYADQKIMVTPLRADRQHRNIKHWTKWFELAHGKERYPGNMRAGSNSWTMWRKDFSEIGRFRNHRIAGTKWTNEFVRKGFTMVTMEHEPLAKDLGFKKGYDLYKDVEITRTFANGRKLTIND